MLLSGKAEQTVRNELSKKKDGLAGNWKEVLANAALAWLETKNFLASIWQHQDDTEVLEQVNEPLTDVLFVPIAMDGSMFHPGLKKDGVYLLGGEGRERAVEDFDEALSILATMDIPHGGARRPGASGPACGATRKSSDGSSGRTSKRWPRPTPAKGLAEPNPALAI